SGTGRLLSLLRARGITGRSAGRCPAGAADSLSQLPESPFRGWRTVRLIRARQDMELRSPRGYRCRTASLETRLLGDFLARRRRSLEAPAFFQACRPI